MADVFISYAREDQALARSLEKELSLFHSIFIDDRLKPGQEWADVLHGEVKKCFAVVVLLTPSTVDSRGLIRPGWVDQEIRWAGAERIATVTANGGCVPGSLHGHHHGDITGWFAGQWHPVVQKLLEKITELKTAEVIHERAIRLEDEKRILQERLAAHSSERGNILSDMHARIAAEAATNTMLQQKFEKMEAQFADLLVRVAHWKLGAAEQVQLVEFLTARIDELQAKNKKLADDVLHHRNVADELATRHNELEKDLDASRREYEMYRKGFPSKPPS